jgi:hypothetical protein
MTAATNTTESTPFDLSSLRRQAVQREIRQVEPQKAQTFATLKQQELNKYRKELLDRVQAHMQTAQVKPERAAEWKALQDELLQKMSRHVEDLDRIQLKQADLAKFKRELLAKVEDHLMQMDRLMHKQADLSLYKEELLNKVKSLQVVSQ